MSGRYGNDSTPFAAINTLPEMLENLRRLTAIERSSGNGRIKCKLSL